MAVLNPRPSEPSAPTAPPAIALLRLTALEYRAAPRRSLQAYAVLAPDAQAEDHSVALVRALQGATDRRFVFWQPGAPGLSFDETWLLALLRACATGDRDSERFLMTRRIVPQARPVIRLLADALRTNLDEFRK